MTSVRSLKNSESQETREEEETLRVGTLEVLVPAQGQGSCQSQNKLQRQQERSEISDKAISVSPHGE